MKKFRHLCFTIVLIAFIGWSMYFYLHEVSSKFLGQINFYTFTVLEMLLAVMGAFYMITAVIMSVGYLFFVVVKKIKA